MTAKTVPPAPLESKTIRGAKDALKIAELNAGAANSALTRARLELHKVIMVEAYGQTEGSLLMLSARQREVFEIIMLGMKNKAIADVLNVSERTVKFHVSAILARLNVRTRVELLVRYRATMFPTAQDVAPKGQ